MIDYRGYIRSRISDRDRAEEIIASWEKFRERCPQHPEVDFINNFYDLLPGFGARQSQENWLKSIGKSLDTPYSELPDYRLASDKMKAKTPRLFFAEIDEVIGLLGVENNITETNLHLEDVVRVMIELMSRGYRRYPDLAR